MPPGVEGGRVHFGLLGPVEAWVDGRSLPLGGAQRRCVLAVLLLEPNRVVPVQRVVELVWGEQPPMAARNTVATHVSRLRKTLAGDPGVRLLARGAGYALLVDADRVDLHRFRRLVREAGTTANPERSAALLRSALELWRGPPLADLAASELHRRLGVGLQEEWLTALEERLAADLRRRPAAVITELVDLVAEHPLRERLAELWLLALYRSGRQADALAAYRRVRDRLVHELGIEPGPALRSLHVRILANDPALHPPAPAVAVEAAGAAGAVQRTSPRSVPAQLPADVPGFTGRVDELRVLDALLVGAAAPVVGLLSGTAGVGKTALAVHWAHRVRDRFPDGQLYVDLRGYDPGRPVPTGDALTRLLGAIGVVAADVPLDVDERAARFRTEIAGHRVLLLLDNASSVEQVRPLLPGSPSCLVLVTSRDSLGGLAALHGARRLGVDLLPEPDAITLLGTMIGDRVAAEPLAARLLAEQCARLPLAMRVAAELAVTRADIPLADLVRELADRQQRLRLLDLGGDVRAVVGEVFSWSYHHLPPAAARLFRRLGLHPGPDFDVPAVAALVGADRAADHCDARRLLEVLVRAHLVHPVPGGRYGMHDLLRAYATTVSYATDPDADRGAALTGLFDHYLATASRAMRVLHPAERTQHSGAATTVALAEPAQARAWLDAELPNLAAVCAVAAGHELPAHAVRLAGVLYRYLEGGHHAAALAIHTHALQAARLCGDAAGEAHALTNLGAVHRLLGRYEPATEQLHAAATLHCRTGDRHGEARALSNLGIVEDRLGNHQAAADLQRRALALYRDLGDRYGEAATLTNLGGIHSRPGHYPTAAGQLTQALELFRSLGDRVGEASALSNLGEVHTSLGRHEQAAEHLRQALELFRDTDHRYGQAIALSNLGQAETRLGRHEQAAAHLYEAIDLFRVTGHRYGEASALNGLGEVLRATGRPGDALSQHTTALAITAETGDRDELARAHLGIASAREAANTP